jgi:hypothetical protein
MLPTRLFARICLLAPSGIKHPSLPLLDLISCILQKTTASYVSPLVQLRFASVSPIHTHTHTHSMPVPCPPGALPAAHRVMCLDTCRLFASGHSVQYGFTSSYSEKCEYCTSMGARCWPVSPLFLVGQDVMILIPIDP